MWCTVLPSTFIVRHWARRIDTELLAFAKGGFAGWNGKRCVVDWSSFPVRVGGVGNDRPLAQHRSVAVVLAEVRPIEIKAVGGGERKSARTHPFLQTAGRFARILGVLVHLKGKHPVVVAVLVDEPQPAAGVWVGVSRAVQVHLVPFAGGERVVVETFDVVPVNLGGVLVQKINSSSFVFKVVVFGERFGALGDIGQGAVRGGGDIRGPYIWNDWDGGDGGCRQAEEGKFE